MFQKKYFHILLITTLLSLFCIETHAQKDTDIKRSERKNADNLKELMSELTNRFDTIDKYWRHGQPEFAAELSNIQYQQLQKISSYDFPKKTPYLVQLGNLYYDFKDYPKAIFYFKEALSEPAHIHNQEQQLGAYNNLGLCYRYGFNDFDRSDSCFQAILQAKYLNPDEELKRDLWDAVATGNLGRNMLLRKEYDKALPLLSNSLETVLKYNDYTYATRVVLDLADIYLQKNNPKEVKRYIDLFNLYNKKKNKSEYLAYFYEIKSKYYALIGNSKLAIAYLDSTLTESKKKEERFNALQLLRVELRQHLSEQKLKEEQLYAEKIKSDGYKRSLIITVIALLLIGSVLAFYFVLYRKNKAAYHELVRKSQEWAQASMPGAMLENTVNETNRILFDQFQQLLQLEEFYLDNTISIEKIAVRMNTNRTYLSRAINKCTGMSFSAYINECRIKKAVLLISNHSERFSFEGIAFEVGFNDRKTFYMAFKKMTGLSPSAFRDNVKMD